MGVENRTGLYALPADPELADLYRVWGRKIGLAIRTAVPGTVTVYDPSTQEASVTVDYLEIQRVTQQIPGAPDPSETNAVLPKAPLLLTKVPVCPVGSGNGTGYLTFPILPGCTGVLLVLDRSKDTWVNRTASVPVDPVKSSIHDLADCVFFPGLTDRLHRISVPTDLTAAVLEASLIKLGRNAVQHVAIAEALVAAVDALLAAGVAFVGVPADPSGENAGGAFLAAQGAWSALKSQIASIKVSTE